MHGVLNAALHQVVANHHRRGDSSIERRGVSSAARETEQDVTSVVMRECGVNNSINVGRDRNGR